MTSTDPVLRWYMRQMFMLKKLNLCFSDVKDSHCFLVLFFFMSERHLSGVSQICLHLIGLGVLSRFNTIFRCCDGSEGQGGNVEGFQTRGPTNTKV